MTDESSSSNRRRYLKYAGSTLFVGLAGCSGGGGGAPTETATPTSTETSTPASEPNHEVPHPGGDEVPEAEANAETLSGGTRSPGAQSEKDGPSVQLQHIPNGNQYCGKCSLYVPDQNGDGFGACASVAGKIHPCDWCLLYSEYSGETVSCGQA
jgi:hypothetical protein